MWGRLAKVAIPNPKKTKISSKTVDCIFIGYAMNCSAYRFLIYKSEHSEMHVNTIIESQNASFFEHVFPNKTGQETSTNKRSYDAITSHDLEQYQEQEQEIDQNEEDELRYSKRARTSKSFSPNFLTFLLENEPLTFEKAMSGPKAPLWKEAVNIEVESILQNHTWELVDLPPRCKPLGYKWIFKRKMKADGSIDKYKQDLWSKDLDKKKV